MAKSLTRSKTIKQWWKELKRDSKKFKSRSKKISKSNHQRKTSEEHKRKISEAMVGNKNAFGYRKKEEECRTPLNNRIRQGIESRLWRESVFARDNWTCQKCKIRGCKLHPHHIQNFAQYPELRFAIDNGITFCKECHESFHKKYGKKDNNLEQIKEFLSAMVG